MRKILTAMTALSALALAAPAIAQTGTTNWRAGGSVGIQNRIAQVENRIRLGVQSGVINRTEAMELRQDLRDIRRLERQYSANGLTQIERQDLQQRLRALRQDVRVADNGRYDQYTNWQDDPYDRRYTGVGGPLEEVDCRQRGGIGGIIGGILGRDDTCGLRVGQRATGDLYGVPYEYRNQYRDGNGIYYRSDGRMIYQIDARTNTVLRVYAQPR